MDWPLVIVGIVTLGIVVTLLNRGWMTRGQVLPPVASVTVSPVTFGLHPSESVNLLATAFDGPNGTGNVLSAGYSFVWTSTNGGIAPVNPGLGGNCNIAAPVVKGALGTATILVACTGGGGAASATATINVVVGGPVAAQCSAVVPNGTTGQTTTVTVFTADIAGNPCNTGGAAVVGKVTGANTATMVTVDNGDGTYTLTYAPSVAGSDTVSLFVNGNAINGSPFTSTVQQAVTVTAVSVTPTSVSGTVGTTAQLTAVTTPPGFGVGWSNTNPAVASWATGHGNDNPVLVNLLSVGATNIQAFSGGSPGSNVVPFTVSALAPLGSYPSLPAGYTAPSALTTDDLTTVTEGNWSVVNGTITIRNAATYNPINAIAPRNPPISPQGIGEALYPAGFSGSGIAPCQLFAANFSANGWTGLYFMAVVQLSSNWQSHPSGVNKVLIARIGASEPKFVLSATGASFWECRLQGLGVGPGAVNVVNVSGANAGVTLGLWQRIEIQLIGNTPGIQNGVIRVWLTNYNSSGVAVSGPTLITNATNIGWEGTGGSNIWTSCSWEPIWGGTSSTTVASQMYMWMDHLAYGGHV